MKHPHHNFGVHNGLQGRVNTVENLLQELARTREVLRWEREQHRGTYEVLAYKRAELKVTREALERERQEHEKAQNDLVHERREHKKTHDALKRERHDRKKDQNDLGAIRIALDKKRKEYNEIHQVFIRVKPLLVNKRLKVVGRNGDQWVCVNGLLATVRI